MAEARRRTVADLASSEPEWRASDYDWDPATLQARKKRAVARGGDADAGATPAVVVPEGAALDEQLGLNISLLQPELWPTPLLSSLPVLNLDKEDDEPASVCQVVGCGVSLLGLKRYYIINRVCEAHLRSPAIIVNGTLSRFCQQCNKFQFIGKFSGSKRSCTYKLERHNARHRAKMLAKRQAQQGEAGQAGEADGAGGGEQGEKQEEAEEVVAKPARARAKRAPAGRGKRGKQQEEEDEDVGAELLQAQAARQAAKAAAAAAAAAAASAAAAAAPMQAAAADSAGGGAASSYSGRKRAANGQAAVTSNGYGGMPGDMAYAPGVPNGMGGGAAAAAHDPWATPPGAAAADSGGVLLLSDGPGGPAGVHGHGSMPMDAYGPPYHMYPQHGSPAYGDSAAAHPAPYDVACAMGAAQPWMPFAPHPSPPHASSAAGHHGHGHGGDVVMGGMRAADVKREGSESPSTGPGVVPGAGSMFAAGAVHPHPGMGMGMGAGGGWAQRAGGVPGGYPVAGMGAGGMANAQHGGPVPVCEGSSSRSNSLNHVDGIAAASAGAVCGPGGNSLGPLGAGAAGAGGAAAAGGSGLAASPGSSPSRDDGAGATTSYGSGRGSVGAEVGHTAACTAAATMAAAAAAAAAAASGGGDAAGGPGMGQVAARISTIMQELGPLIDQIKKQVGPSGAPSGVSGGSQSASQAGSGGHGAVVAGTGGMGAAVDSGMTPGGALVAATGARGSSSAVCAAGTPGAAEANADPTLVTAAVEMLRKASELASVLNTNAPGGGAAGGAPGLPDLHDLAVAGRVPGAAITATGGAYGSVTTGYNGTAGAPASGSATAAAAAAAGGSAMVHTDSSGNLPHSPPTLSADASGSTFLPSAPASAHHPHAYYPGGPMQAGGAPGAAWWPSPTGEPMPYPGAVRNGPNGCPTSPSGGRMPYGGPYAPLPPGADPAGYLPPGSGTPGGYGARVPHHAYPGRYPHPARHVYGTYAPYPPYPVYDPHVPPHHLPAYGPYVSYHAVHHHPMYATAGGHPHHPGQPAPSSVPRLAYGPPAAHHSPANSSGVVGGGSNSGDSLAPRAPAGAEAQSYVRGGGGAAAAADGAADRHLAALGSAPGVDATGGAPGAAVGGPARTMSFDDAELVSMLFDLGPEGDFPGDGSGPVVAIGGAGDAQQQQQQQPQQQHSGYPGQQQQLHAMPGQQHQQHAQQQPPSHEQQLAMGLASTAQRYLAAEQRTVASMPYGGGPPAANNWQYGPEHHQPHQQHQHQQHQAATTTGYPGAGPAGLPGPNGAPPPGAYSNGHGVAVATGAPVAPAPVRGATVETGAPRPAHPGHHQLHHQHPQAGGAMQAPFGAAAAPAWGAGGPADVAAGYPPFGSAAMHAQHAQHAAAAAYGAGLALEEDERELERVSLKVMNLLPHELPPNMRSNLRRWLKDGQAEMQQATLRPGCVQLVVDVSLRGGRAAAAALPSALIPAHDADQVAADVFRMLGQRLRDTFVQVGRQVLQIRMGEDPVVMNWEEAAEDGGLAGAKMPEIKGVSVPAVCSGSEASLSLHGLHMQQQRIKAYARLRGHDLPVDTLAPEGVVAEADGLRVTVSLPPRCMGLMVVEAGVGHLLGGWWPVVVLPSGQQTAAEELRALQEQLQEQGAAAVEAMRRMVVDLGKTLETLSGTLEADAAAEAAAFARLAVSEGTSFSSGAVPPAAVDGGGSGSGSGEGSPSAGGAGMQHRSGSGDSAYGGSTAAGLTFTGGLDSTAMGSSHIHTMSSSINTITNTGVPMSPPVAARQLLRGAGAAGVPNAAAATHGSQLPAGTDAALPPPPPPSASALKQALARTGRLLRYVVARPMPGTCALLLLAAERLSAALVRATPPAPPAPAASAAAAGPEREPEELDSERQVALLAAAGVNPQMLLPLALLSGSPAVAVQLAGFAARVVGAPLRLDLPQGPLGMTPLHMAAVLPDGGAMACALVSSVPWAAWAWVSQGWHRPLDLLRWAAEQRAAGAGAQPLLLENGKHGEVEEEEEEEQDSDEEEEEDEEEGSEEEGDEEEEEGARLPLHQRVWLTPGLLSQLCGQGDRALRLALAMLRSAPAARQGTAQRVAADPRVGGATVAVLADAVQVCVQASSAMLALLCDQLARQRL